MKRLIHLATALVSAFVALLLLAGAVQSAPQSDRVVEPPLRPAYSYTRIVTITVDSSTVPLTPGLSSLWQIETIDQFILGAYQIPLPDDAYEISVALPISMYHIDPGPTLVITGPQSQLYFEYRTNQRALRFGNQILITHTAVNNQQYRYLSTLIFTGPYQYLGTSGFVPTEITASAVHWDAVPEIGDDGRYRFLASAWLVDTRLPDTRPDLEIITATVLGQRDRFYVTADIRNNGPITAWAPAYINLSDRIAPSTPPTGPLDLTGSWCSPATFSWCGGGANNPLPAVLPGQTVVFTAEYALSAINGWHEIYLFVDALGGSQGLNVESSENNNVILAGSLFRRGETVFLPLIQR